MKSRRNFYSAAAAFLFAALVGGAFATPAFAQTPNPQAEKYFQQYMASNPELQRNPSLMNDPRWLQAHPDFHKFLEQHPNVAAQAHEMGASGYRGNNGAYDEHHQWHNRKWWMKNRREWVETHQPGWLRQQPNANYGHGAPPYNAAYANPPYGHNAPPAYVHPVAPNGVGDYDAHHQWHDRSWWVANDHAWVQQHHPDWVQHH